MKSIMFGCVSGSSENARSNFVIAAKYGWEFLFLGANIDAAKEAARFGISEDRAANYHADHLGTAVIYEAMSKAVCNVRACRPMTAD